MNEQVPSSPLRVKNNICLGAVACLRLPVMDELPEQLKFQPGELPGSPKQANAKLVTKFLKWLRSCPQLFGQRHPKSGKSIWSSWHDDPQQDRTGRLVEDTTPPPDAHRH